MKRKNPSMFLCGALVSLIGVLMIGFLGLGVRAFATADTTRFIFFVAGVISVAILVLYFTLRRPTRELTVHSRFRKPPFVKRFPFSRLSTIDRNPLTLDPVSEKPSRATLAAVKTVGDSLIVSGLTIPMKPSAPIAYTEEARTDHAKNYKPYKRHRRP
jgi:hypothetical protein